MDAEFGTQAVCVCARVCIVILGVTGYVNVQRGYQSVTHQLPTANESCSH